MRVVINMSYLDCFDEEMLYNVVVTGRGETSSFDLSGRPVYGTGATKYNSDGAVWQLSASEILANDRISNPSTHQIILEPSRITGNLADSDTATITINGVEEIFDINMPYDIMGMGEVMMLTAVKRVVK